MLAVSTPSEIDLELYSMWVAGKSVDHAHYSKLEIWKKAEISFRLEFRGGSREQFKVDQNDLARNEVVDQYRSFELLEQFLQQPMSLRNQCLVVIKPEFNSYLIDNYWSVDDVFLKELLNKKLTRSRKDLDEAAEMFRLNVRSLSRQYDNIKRLYNAYEDPVNIAENNIYSFITRNFLLGPILARKYACFIFLLVTKFNFTSKKRLLNVESSK